MKVILDYDNVAQFTDQSKGAWKLVRIIASLDCLVLEDLGVLQGWQKNYVLGKRF